MSGSTKLRVILVYKVSCNLTSWNRYVSLVCPPPPLLSLPMLTATEQLLHLPVDHPVRRSWASDLNPDTMERLQVVCILVSRFHSTFIILIHVLFITVADHLELLLERILNHYYRRRSFIIIMVEDQILYHHYGSRVDPLSSL